MKSNWLSKSINDEAVEEFSASLGIDKSIAAILINRGITNLTDAYHFLNPRLSSLHSPFLMKGMQDAVTRIRTAINRKEKIGIFADSDVDGLTSLTILINLLERLGIKPYYRFAVDDEEYGLRKSIIEEMRDHQIDLIITLDCGIRDIDEIEYACKFGIDVIVCDHHEQKEKLPQAIIVNPKIWDSGYPFKELAGVGVTFKLCQAVLMSYLLSFNKLFIVITREEDCYYCSYVKNGIIEQIDKVDDIFKGNYFNGNLSGNCNIVLFDSEYENKLRDYINDGNIFNFRDLLNSFFTKKINSNLSINDLCKKFSINQKIFKKKHHIVNMMFSEIEYHNSGKISEFLNSIIDLVSVGTVADIMPLFGENRTIIHYGLKSLNKTNHPGLSLLIKKLSSKITAKKIAWDISPLLNTPGRFGKTQLIANFFLEKDKQKLNSLINEINILNDKRKKIITELHDFYYSEIQNGKHLACENLIFIASEKVPDGLCGLLANRIADITGKPVIVISLIGNKESVKGSGRAMGDFNFFSFVEAHSDLFKKIGGHKQAFGFTIDREVIYKLREKIIESIKNCSIEEYKYYIDLDIPLELINYDFINSLDLFEPYGHQNEDCLFLSRNAEIREFKRFGQNMNHGKYMFKNNKALEAIGWDMAEKMEEYTSNKKVDIIYNLENNFYNGRYSPRMRIVDLD
ncbi:MAG: single-stranded-DNA-specific exonuclease RecJ [Spirochaetes bacterium]|nr:single-stranded-DNA-specific exonuclease RecJ [Spirochaetota bacterium]